jgi:DNA repair exonuclease SbcCD ATPase subunit
MKRQIATFAFLVLIVSMIGSSIPNYAYADSQTDSLIRIAMQARDHLRIQLSQTTDASAELNELLRKASAEVEHIQKSAEKDDVPKAREHFLSAMKIFREISQKITEQQTQDTVQATTSQAQASSSKELERLELYIDRLENIANKNKVDVDFSNIYELIDNARDAQREGNYDEKASLEEIKKKILELQNSIKEQTSSSTTERAKSLAQTHLRDLDRLIAQAKEIGVSENTIKKLNEMRGSLNDASDVQQIIKKVKEAISVVSQFEATKTERIKSRINQLQTQFEQLSNYADRNDSNLEKANSMILELQNLVARGELSEAINMINSLKSLLDDMETTISSNQAASPKVENELDNSLNNSKVERIKIKIERLESQLKELSDQIENAAAKRWIENANLQLERVKPHVDDSPDEVLKIITKVEQIIKRVRNTIQ